MLPNITLGASLRPIPTSLGSLLDLLLVVELQDPVRVVREKLSPWQLLHAGAELKMLGGLLSGRAGVNKGWLSLGFGLDILIFEANVAVFTEELGSKPGNQPRTGVSVDFAIRL